MAAAPLPFDIDEFVRDCEYASFLALWNAQRLLYSDMGTAWLRKV